MIFQCNTISNRRTGFCWRAFIHSSDYSLFLLALAVWSTQKSNKRFSLILVANRLVVECLTVKGQWLDGWLQTGLEEWAIMEEKMDRCEYQCSKTGGCDHGETRLIAHLLQIYRFLRECSSSCVMCVVRACKGVSVVKMLAVKWDIYYMKKKLYWLLEKRWLVVKEKHIMCYC